MKIIDRLKGLLNGEPNLIAEKFRELNKVQPGLGDKTVSYIVSGENETVLATLSQILPTQNPDPGSPNSWYGDKQLPQRQKLLLLMEPFDFELVRRFGEVCAQSGRDAELAGSAKVPLAIRYIFTHVFVGFNTANTSRISQPEPLTGSGLTRERALELIDRMGGVPADLLDVIYVRMRRWGIPSGALYAEAIDLASLAASQPAIVMEASKRMPADGRAALISDLSKWKLAATPGFLEWTLEMVPENWTVS